MTEKLYETDSYCREFTATVESCVCEDGIYKVILNRTAFFPEGGGQAADGGTLNGSRVLDVQLEGDCVVHKTETPFSQGQEVVGILDWELRFSRMQSHAGEHIVSGVVHGMYGYSNVGFHMGDTVMTVDFSGSLTVDDIREIEVKSNQAIYQNAPIRVSFPSKDELATLDYRSKLELEDGVRIITIGEIDCCACCAPHPATTGEIGIIKIIDHYPNKQGTRIEMLAGIHALEDYARLNRTNKVLMGLLSAPRDGVEDAVYSQNELAQTLRSENQRLAKRLAMAELTPIEVGAGVYGILDGVSYDELRYCSNELLSHGAATCVLLSKTEETGYSYVVASKDKDVRQMVAALNHALNGKGGGKSDFAQGKISADSEDEIKTVITNILQDA